MSPPIATAPAAVGPAHLPSSSGSNAGSFSSFFDDIDQFILKENNNNDFILNNFNSLSSDENSFKSLLSTSPTNSCSSLLNNNLLNSNEFDLFKFDKANYGINAMDFGQYGDSLCHNINDNNGTCNNMPSLSNNINDQINNGYLPVKNDNMTDEHGLFSNIKNEEGETHSDEEHSLFQNFLQDQELDCGSFNINSPDDNDHMINDFGMISMTAASNNDALVAIRDMAIDKRQMSRKHKNSTSSISSVSMSSTIKKVAIELQNSTANLVSSTSTAGAFMESAVPAQNTCNLVSNQNIESTLADEFDDETGFDDLLGLDDWEQMLDEDCISRLTTDFSNNFTNNTNQKTISPSNPTITTLTNPVKLPITTIQNTKNTAAAQTSRLVPHISTLSNQQSNKSNQPLVLVLSSSGSSPSQANPAQNALTTQKLKTTTTTAGSPSLTPIASTSPMNNHIKKISTTTTIAPTKIISTTKTSPTSNVVKKLNSVIISDTNTRTNSPIDKSNKSSTIKLENNNNEGQQQRGLATSYSNFNHQNLILKNNKSNYTIGPSITNTTNKTITRHMPLSLTNNNSSIKPTRNMNSLNLQRNNVSLNSANNSSLSSASSSPNLSPTSSSSPSSLIDYNEVIQCVNPDQIFPYRLPLLRFVKTENDTNKIDENEWCQNKYYSTHQCDDDEEEEEIDVVSVHNNTSHLNMNHHNYAFYSPAAVSTPTLTTKKLSGTKKSTKNNNNDNSGASNVINQSKNVELAKTSIVKQSGSNRKSNSTSNKKNSTTSKQTTSSSSANPNITQLNSIRILTTTSANGSTTNNIRQINTTSIAKTPQTPSIKLTNNYSQSPPTPLIINKDSTSMSSLTPTTKYITMTPSKLNNNNFKCQAITPTISSNKPKVVTATNNNLLNFSSNSITSTANTHMHNNLKFNSSTNGATGSYITTLKIPTSLSKIGKKVSGKAKGDDVTYLMKSSNNNANSMLTEEDEFFDDEASRKSFNSAAAEKPKATISNQIVKNDFNIKLSSENSTSFTNTHNQFNSVKFEEELDAFMDDDIDDDIDDDDDDIDDEDDDECSSSSSASSPSPNTSRNSSGYSTPTKASKLKAELSDRHDNDSFDISNLNEKLSKKPKKMNSSSSSSLSSGSVTLNQSSKRNSRLSSMGYSSDNPAEKRAFHILSERQRRNDLKKLFETLRTNIPTLCDKQKASKLTILKAAVDHLCEISNKKEKLSSVYDKEKARHAQLMQHLKNLQQHHQPMQQQINFNYQTVQTSGQSTSLSTLAVH